MENSYNKPVQKEPMFSSLEFKENRGRTLWMSVLVHGFLLTVLLAIPLFMTDQLKLKHYDLWMLAPPPPPKQVLAVTHYKLPPPPPVEKRIVTPPAPEVKLPPPPKPEPRPEPKPLPKPEIVNIPKTPPVVKLPEPEPIKPEPAPPPKIVKTEVFSNSPPPPPTTNLPARQVQTGGFGDPNGIKGDGRSDKATNIASLGAFDLPVGPGAGNGTGGARGKAGIVSAGFGSATADAKPASNARQTVREGGFGDANGATSSGGARPAQRAAAPVETPAEILFKPKPDYTEDARRAKMEGEVLLRVLFTAAGEIRVLDTLNGLGHGLDENAVKAAKLIRFKPATRDGKPVDFTAVVHIVFQLAN